MHPTGILKLKVEEKYTPDTKEVIDLQMRNKQNKPISKWETTNLADPNPALTCTSHLCCWQRIEQYFSTPYSNLESCDLFWLKSYECQFMKLYLIAPEITCGAFLLCHSAR